MWSEDRERQPYIIPRSENPRELLSFQMKLSASRRARVGLDGNCCVLAIDENGEAAKAGLRVGDRLVSVTVMSQDGDVENPVSTRAQVNQIFANAVGTLEIHALRSLRNRALDGYADDVFLYSPTRIRPSGATLVDLAAVAAVDSAKHGLTSSRVAARDGSSENSTRYGRRRRNQEWCIAVPHDPSPEPQEASGAQAASSSLADASVAAALTERQAHPGDTSTRHVCDSKPDQVEGATRLRPLNAGPSATMSLPSADPQPEHDSIQLEFVSGTAPDGSPSSPHESPFARRRRARMLSGE